MERDLDASTGGHVNPGNRLLRAVVGLLLCKSHYWGVVNKHLQNHLLDLFLGGSAKGFSGNVPPSVEGATATQSIDYVLIKEGIKAVRLDRAHICVDVGSGYGRALAFLAWKNPHVQFIGYELNHGIAEDSRIRLGRFRNIEVRSGDILESEVFADVFVLFNPFDAKTLARFVEWLRIHKSEATCLYINAYPDHMKVLRDVNVPELQAVPLHRPLCGIENKLALVFRT